MSKTNVIIAVLVLLVMMLSVKTWMDNDADDKESKESYKQQVQKQQDIITDNHNQIEYLKYQNLKLDLINDSLFDLTNQSKERVRIIYRDNDETHSNIDTTGQHGVDIYWATELPGYFNELTERASENENE